MDLSEKVVVITGASMGIGEAIAKLFADHGASIVFSSRDQARAEAARARVGHPQQSLAVACDVCDPAQISALLRAALERFGRVDIWVNNAGFGVVDSIERMDRQAYRRMFETNCFGAIEAMQQVIPVMQRQGSGCIINISSVAGYIAVPYMGAYGATKRALNAISRAARLELEGTRRLCRQHLPRLRENRFREECGARRGSDSHHPTSAARDHRRTRCRSGAARLPVQHHRDCRALAQPHRHRPGVSGSVCG